MSALSGTYDEASAAFYRNNEAIVAARDAQASLDEFLGRVGEAVANIKTSVQADFMPSITQMLDGIAALASGDESGVDQLTQGITEVRDVTLAAMTAALAVSPAAVTFTGRNGTEQTRRFYVTGPEAAEKTVRGGITYWSGVTFTLEEV